MERNKIKLELQHKIEATATASSKFSILSLSLYVSYKILNEIIYCVSSLNVCRIEENSPREMYRRQEEEKQALLRKNRLKMKQYDSVGLHILYAFYI